MAEGQSGGQARADHLLVNTDLVSEGVVHALPEGPARTGWSLWLKKAYEYCW